MLESSDHPYISIVALFMKENGLMVYVMDKESKSGLMEVATKVSGVMAKPTAKANCTTLMEIFMKVNG